MSFLVMIMSPRNDYFWEEGLSVHLDLLSSATKIPRKWGVMLTTKKTLKVEKGEMENKICGKMVKVARNGLNTQDALEVISTQNGPSKMN